MILANVLVIYWCEIETNDAYQKMKQTNTDFESSFDEIKEKIYQCNSNFYAKQLLKYWKIWIVVIIGFIIINGDGFLYVVLIGNNYKGLCKMKPNSPNKYKNGGQSQKAFERLTGKEARNGCV